MARPITRKDQTLCIKPNCEAKRHVGRLCEQHYANYVEARGLFGWTHRRQGYLLKQIKNLT